MRYPFRARLDEFLRVYEHSGRWNAETLDDRARTLRRIGGIVEALHREGRLSTCDPVYMTSEDVRDFYIERSGTVSPISCTRELSVLGSLCDFYGNDCVRVAKTRYPFLVPKIHRRRLSGIDAESMARIVSASSDADDFFTLRAFASVLLAMCGGLRWSEIRNCRVDDYDPGDGTLYLGVVKGGDTYGEPRTVLIRPEARPVLARYLEVRGRFLADRGVRSPYWIPASTDGGVLPAAYSYNLLCVVCDAVGLDFDFRALRRTYIQAALDDGIDLEAVSVLAGHATTKTTERYYGRRREGDAIEAARSAWDAGVPR
ncbi:tyrosine-type recombinase/integrase [Candidatus Methanoprimaticola sp. MG2]|uniref:tyrosine-type recombinase/integrase n=1 Tax=Candidatus Methanoprimaticola sp. MG2 TaxID=3228838 RepID=UPI0039C63353